jgi:hypothetical protein
MDIESFRLSTSSTAALCGMTEGALANYLRQGLTPDARRGQGYPAEYRLLHILRVWLLGQLLKVGVRREDAIFVANHADVFGAMVNGEPVRVFFPGGVPKLSGDPARDPVLWVPYGDFVHEAVHFIAAHIRRDHGEDVAATVLERFDAALAAARARG